MRADHQPRLVLSTGPPPKMPGSGFSFAPYTAKPDEKLITVDMAMAVAQETGVNADAWTNGTRPTVCLVEFTNTFHSTRTGPAWVIWVNDVPIREFGPREHQRPTASITGIAEWIIDAITGHFLGAANRGADLNRRAPP